MNKFTYKGRQLEYEVTGEGIPFVFLHGMGGSTKQIASAYDPLEGVQLINLNQQGHGNSDADWEHLDFDHLAEDVLALLEELHLDSIYLGGISMGAAVSLNLAVRRPEMVRGLLLVRNAWTDKPMSERVQQAYYDLGMCLQTGGEEAFYQTKGWEIVEAEHSAYTRNAFLSVFKDQTAVKNRQKYLLLPAKTAISSMKELNALTMPVTILANRNDLCHPFAYGEALKEAIPQAKFLEIPDKDRDSEGHRRMMNEEICEMLYL